MEEKSINNCPNCNESIEPHSRNCKYCGAFIAKTNKDYRNDISDMSTVQYEDVPSKRICSKCGEVNNVNASICFNCNANLKNSEVLDKDKDYVGALIEKDYRKERILKWINIAYTVMVGIIILILFILTSSTGGINGIEIRNLYAKYLGLLMVYIISVINIYCPELLFYLKYLWVKEIEPTEEYLWVGRIMGYIISFGCVVYAILLYIGFIS